MIIINVGSRIKELREKRNWSQIDLAKKIGINNSVLSRIEAGKRDVEDYLLNKFGDVFDVSVDFLLGRTDDPKPPNKIDPDTGIDTSEFTPEEIEFFNQFKKEVTFRDYLKAPEESKKAFIEAIKLLMKGMSK